MIKKECISHCCIAKLHVGGEDTAHGGSTWLVSAPTSDNLKSSAAAKTLVTLVIIFACLFQSCSPKINNGDNSEENTAENPGKASIASWLTKGDQSALLQQQPLLYFEDNKIKRLTITVNPAQTYQTIEGFGYSLTGGSAYVINRLAPDVKTRLLNELFGNGNNSIGVSYLRISIGASDLDATVFSYDDIPTGATDVNLDHFSLDHDRADLIPLLKEILVINPKIKILGSPWSPPVWMKDNDSSKGGSLLPEYYDVYAQYFVKYIGQMKAEGIPIDVVTPQNEPLHPGNNPSMLMVAEQERDFIKNSLGPAFKKASITTKIIVYDHNLDRPDYPLTILADPQARSFVEGSAFHLYAGDVNALSKVHDAYPSKGLYFTEQWTGARDSFEGDLKWHVKNVIIGTMRNWCRIALEWNLASDPNYNPHTPGGCTECKGALTIGDSIQRRESYYIIGHASKFVPPGSVRIASNIEGELHNVAFKTPSGKIVLIVENDSDVEAAFNIAFSGRQAAVSLPGGAVATYVW